MGAPKIPQHSGPSESQDSLGFKASVVSSSESRAKSLARELEKSLDGWIQLHVGWEKGVPATESPPPSQIVFVDATCDDLDHRIAELSRDRAALIFLIVKEGEEVPAALVEGRVDDVLLHPFRRLEVLSKLRQLQKSMAHREAVELNESYAKIVELLQEDLKLAERMQKQRLPRRFPEVKGFRATSRYLAGTRSGGDYVDLADARDGANMAVVMTDASSYRLSSAVLDAISRRLANLPADETRSCVTAARRIRDGVLMMMGDRDHLSLFYAVVSRKDYRMKFLNLGTSRVFYAPPGKKFEEIRQGQGDPIVRAISVRTEKEGEIALEPDGRLVVVSDGFIDAAGGVSEVLSVLDQHRSAEPAESLNELTFRAKKPLTGPDDLPVQDCTALILDVDSRLIRLA